MHGLDSLGEDSADTVFRDVIMLALAGFVAVVIMLLPHLNPPTAEDSIMAPGNLIVEIHWPTEIDADVDLWVEAPGDRPVGYSNKGGLIFNLLRDDLGHESDVTDSNYEVSYSRGLPTGEYVINLHLYRNNSKALPIPVKLVVSLKAGPQDSARQILSTDVQLARLGEERTAVRFKLDEGHKIVSGSVHDLPKSLRSRKS